MSRTAGLVLEASAGIRIPATGPRPWPRDPEDQVRLSPSAGRERQLGARALPGEAPPARRRTGAPAGRPDPQATGPGASRGEPGRPRHRHVAVYERAMAGRLEQDPQAVEAARTASIHVAA